MASITYKVRPGALLRTGLHVDEENLEPDRENIVYFVSFIRIRALRCAAVGSNFVFLQWLLDNQLLWQLDLSLPQHLVLQVQQVAAPVVRHRRRQAVTRQECVAYRL